MSVWAAPAEWSVSMSSLHMASTAKPDHPGHPECLDQHFFALHHGAYREAETADPGPYGDLEKLT